MYSSNDIIFNYLIKWYCGTYPEFVLIKYGKAHRHRNECHEEKPYYAHRSLETGGMPCHAGATWGSTKLG